MYGLQLPGASRCVLEGKRYPPGLARSQDVPRARDVLPDRLVDSGTSSHQPDRLRERLVEQTQLQRQILVVRLHDRSPLLPTRMMDPNFAVTNGFVSALTMMALPQEAPDTLAPSERRKSDRQGALELLRNYLRELGKSLPAKSSRALEANADTYQVLGGGKYCDAQPLIPDAEMKATRRGHALAERNKNAASSFLGKV
jgi:hypothetical protein